MKTTLINIAWICLFVSLGSCYEDPGTDIVVGNEAFLELQDAGRPNPSISKSFTKDADGSTDPVTVKVQVNIMGRPQKQDVSADFTIVGTSTAVAGTHYNMVTTGSSVVIPAGASSANIEFQVLPDAFIGTAAQTLAFSLTGGDLPLSKYTIVTYSLTAQ